MWDGHVFAKSVREGGNPWTLIGELARHWFDCSVEEPVVQESALRAFVKWQGMVNACPALAKGNDDHLVDLSHPDDEYRAFLVENQSVWTLALRTADSEHTDPPVYCKRDAGGDDVEEWTQLNPRFSQFALQWAVYSTRFRSDHSANGYVGDSDLSRILELISPMAFPTWEAMFHAEFHFFAGEDLLIQLDRDRPGPWNWIWIEGRTRSALDRAMSLVKCDWA